MCRRYSLSVRVETVVETALETRVDVAHLPRTNIAPGEMAPVLVRQSDGLSVAVFRWGLLPSWTSQRRLNSPCVNAPAETVANDLPLRGALERRRCAVAADGFYLWKHSEFGKVSWKFRRADGRVFLMAGLWETWADHRGGEPIQTFAIITTASNSLVAPVHERMPAILVGDAAPIWLDPRSSPADRLAVLRPAPDGFLTARQDSPAVPSAIRSDRECVASAY